MKTIDTSTTTSVGRSSTDSKPKFSSWTKPPPGPIPKCQELHGLDDCTRATPVTGLHTSGYT
ncbi:hypothetical protein PC116_g18422 [Phytophthora cactorum]|nr:hypothetical protein PC114_g17643 [Phytophthora cactorum]KAG2965103.1 hypothetical protein PC119_g25070 [Phytophthora cactorum]KAG3126031.1 hypothetical protein C6341_g25532 [Phytophthora cactorum]KAG4233372.1 hypothetical protein PC116_g18422 [Phytophthora cactorum]